MPNMSQKLAKHNSKVSNPQGQEVREDDNNPETQTRHGRHGQEGDQSKQPHLEVEVRRNPLQIILENFEQMPQLQPNNKKLQFIP